MRRFSNKTAKQKIKFISFDLDGTLADTNFERLVWFREIPKLYARKNKMKFEDAKKVVIAEYDKMGDKELEWYDVNYWFRKFGLKGNYRKMMRALKHEIKLYRETIPVLKKLKKRYKLVVFSNASRDFLNLKIEAEGIRKFFYRVFSSTSDFKKVKKTAETYLFLCKKLKINPEELAHIGDNYGFDYVAPRKAGIISFHLDRTEERSGRFRVRSLKEFERKLAEVVAVKK